MTLLQFISLLDGSQSDDTTVIINTKGAELLESTLSEIQETLLNSINNNIHIKANELTVKSFMFYKTTIVIETE